MSSGIRVSIIMLRFESLFFVKCQFSTADEAQVYDLGCTIGEVGLSEIKLVPKHSIKEKTTVKYRLQQQTEIRPIIRPHTMSSVSPYSSTNSLNSSDSSGIIGNQRMSIPAAPNRKKRVAPRPPSQNSIPETDEKLEPKVDAIQEDSTVFKKPLQRQNFHVSSPNLCTNATQLQLSTSSSTNTSKSSSFNRKQIDEVHYKKLSLRPLSMQFTDEQRSPSVSTNSNSSRNHSRTSSETSDITKDGPEAAQRKKPPAAGEFFKESKQISILISSMLSTAKKKAPIPPPRTISTITTNNVKTVLQNLNEEQLETEQMNGDEDISNHSDGKSSPIMV